MCITKRNLGELVQTHQFTDDDEKEVGPKSSYCLRATLILSFKHVPYVYSTISILSIITHSCLNKW